MIHTSPQLDALPSPDRRRFVQGVFAGSAALAAGTLRLPAQAQSRAYATPGDVLSGSDFRLDIGASLVNFTGRERPAITVNDRLPAPTLRWREGDTVALRVSNRLPPGVQTSIHWHGIVLPANMRSEEHTSELQSRENLVCRLLLEKKKNHTNREA